jgi:hypothetical protein
MGEDRQGGRGTTTIVLTKRAALGLLGLVLLIGIAVGRFVSSDGIAGAAALQSDATPAATQESETDELNRLRTQVAQTAVCVSPSPTSEPSPTATATPVPPVAMGTPVNAADNWTVVVTGMTPAPTLGDLQPAGKFVQVNATLTNNAAEARTYNFRDWILVDDRGRVFGLADGATTQASGTNWYRGVDPSLPKDFTLIFDVAVDAGPAFVLESKSDPTLRVAVQIQILG